MRANQNETLRESFMAYSDTQLFINGTWRPSHSGKTIDVLNPATEETIGTVASVHHDVRSEAAKMFRNAAADARGRARHDRYSAGQTAHSISGSA